jgi:hypothetical protein
MKMRILVCGTRNTLTEEQEKIIQSIMDEFGDKEDHILIHGGSPGVDLFIASMAKKKGWTIIEEKPDWSLGKIAAMTRNRKMVEVHRPDILIAFPSPSSYGSNGCVKIAEEKNIEKRVTLFQ